MAIGARITSDNLSGKTATVSFVPYTGSTSGSTQNLGSKTIPFNNITSHPYGIYSLYFAEYDYTYTLTVTEPHIGVQLYVYSDRMVESDNYGVATLNFNDFTADIIDLDVNINDWNNHDIYELTESGFMYYFRSNIDSADRLVIFTDSSNTEIERYSGSTSSFSRNTLEGTWVTAEFSDLGVLKYSDGVSVYTYTWDPVTHYIDIEWNWNASTSDGVLIFKKYENGPWTYNGNGESYLVNPNDGTTTLFKTWTDGTDITHLMSKDADFIAVHTRDNTNNNRYTGIEIYDSTGTVLKTVSLTGDTYNNYSGQFHGTNKFTFVYYNSGDDNIDYKIVHYNGNTGRVVESSHVRGSLYPNFNIIGRGDYFPSNDALNNGGVVIAFYNETGYATIGFLTNYCDFVYMLDNQTSFTTYVFANNTTKTFAPWNIQLSDIIRLACDNGDNNLSFLTIKSSGTRIESMYVSSSDIEGFNTRFLGNKTLVQIWTNSNNSVTYKYINAIGNVVDEISYDLASQYSTNMYTRGKVGYIAIGTLNDGNLAFSLRDNNIDFIPTTFYEQAYNTDYYYAETGQLPETLLMVSPTGGTASILTLTGMTSEFEIPVLNSSYDIRLGVDKFMIVYVDTNDNNYVKIKLYDLSGNLLNSESTTYTNWNDAYGIKNRFVVRIYDGGGSVNIFYLVSENVISSVTLQSFDSEEKINDYIWYD